MKTMNDYHILHLKCDVLLLADGLKTLEIVASKIMGYARAII